MSTGWKETPPRVKGTKNANKRLIWEIMKPSVSEAVHIRLTYFVVSYLCKMSEFRSKVVSM